MEQMLENIGVGKRPIDDPFFEESYRVCKIFQRKGITCVDDEELCHEVIREFPCHAPECKAVFQTLVDFEMHYNSSHRYVCAECKKAKPNPRLLDIHIQETHDSFFKVLSEKQPMYQCYVSECQLKFNNPNERKEHCVDIHKFPKNYRFDIQASYVKREDLKFKMEIDEVNTKCKEEKERKIYINRNQKTRMFTPASSRSTLSDCHNTVCSNILNVNKSTSPLVFIPRQVQKSYSKALTKNQSNQQNILESENMMDLAQALPE